MDLLPRVLVVDDDPDFRAFMAGVLGAHGASVALARDGAEALARLANDPLPHLVFLDIHMPRLDGPAVLRAMRSNPRLASIPVIAVTAGDPDELGVPCLVKPFDAAKLLDLLAAILRTELGPGRDGPLSARGHP
jgi:CheY-like chemotaxis protein